MAQAKKPTREQKRFLRSKGLSPEEWLVIKNGPDHMEVVSRRELAGCELRRIEGVKKKPRTRKLCRDIMIFLTAGTMLFQTRLEASAMEEQEVVVLAEQVGTEYGLCPELLQAVAWQESRYDETAEAEGCIGLMQISELWHRERMDRLQVTNLCDLESNMRVGADYLAELFDRYEDVGMVLMVYSGDSGAEGYAEAGEGLSEYAQKVLEQAGELERQHGK